MTDSDNRYDRHSGPRDRRLRAADTDRAAVADLLRRHHLEGRLDSDEFQQRLDHCYAAKTYADLDQLVEDLPGDERKHTRGWSAPLLPLGRSPLMLLPLAAIAALAISGGHLLWLAIPLLFFVARPYSWGRGHWRVGCGLYQRACPDGGERA